MKPLKPCPFCKDKRETEDYRLPQLINNLGDTGCCVVCGNCRASSDKFFFIDFRQTDDDGKVDDDGRCAAEQAAIDAWNQRHGKWSQEMPEKEGWYRVEITGGRIVCAEFDFFNYQMSFVFKKSRYLQRHIVEGGCIKIHSEPIDMRCDDE